MSFELIYKEIGDLGSYQKYVLLLGWFTWIYVAFLFINSVFLLYIPDHRYVRTLQQNEPRHDKANKVSVRPAKTDQPGHPPSLIRVFAVRLMGS